ncbi:hypothetical protein CTEN210_16737 [Chaetoceros tenuissimus]|uniref:IQ motif and ubiquitin-like domain-containing protein n=1 Tax=Chaetoceros tenuissimus TaxID=426638 RepID=A0AAD3DBJ5_9STRA|nr:hypothetical protein CTEN210_16737 [Chaetoceros tenuissimus]
MKNEHFVMLPLPAGHFHSTACQTPLSFSTTKSCEVDGESVNALPQPKARDDKENISKRLQTKTTSMKDIQAARNEILRWRTARLQEINESEYEDHTKLLQKEMIHHRELKLLQKVDAMEKEYALGTRKRKIDSHLQKLSCDQVWQLQSGPCLIESQTTIYRQKLAKMYQSLEDYRSQKARQRIVVLNDAELLLTTINGSQDVVDLLKRERDMLERNMSKCLSGLRERMLNLCLRIVEQETGKISQNL